MVRHRRLSIGKRSAAERDACSLLTYGAVSMNLNLITVALTLAVLGLVAAFDVIPGAGAWAGMTMFALGGILLMGQLAGTSGFRRQVR